MFKEEASECDVCEGEGWVCEHHPEEPWDEAHLKSCGDCLPCKCNGDGKEGFYSYEVPDVVH